MALVASICLLYKGLPNDVVNLVAQYSTTKKWIYYFTEKGWVRKVWPRCVQFIESALLFKQYATQYVTSHEITYNGRQRYSAMTFVQPNITYEETLPFINVKRVLLRRWYTIVEVGKNKFDYILYMRKYENGYEVSQQHTYGYKWLYRPSGNRWDNSVCILSAQTSTFGEITSISFDDLYANWVWNPQLSIMEFVVDLLNINDDENDEIDWADDE